MKNRQLKMRNLFIAFLLFSQTLFAFDNLDFGEPSKADVVVNREGYAVGYSVYHKQPLWVTYRLTKEEVKADRVARKGFRFMPDPSLSAGSAQLKDYYRSGYDRGHMAPAADMAFSEKTMKESFYLSNICPQTPSFNRGIWARLERKMRYWATLEDEIYIVTGPLFSVEKASSIGFNQVTIPVAFYKAVLDISNPPKAIAFLLPHQGADKKLKEFAITVDELEEKTGFDFFQNLPDEIESKIESTVILGDWEWLEK